MLIIGQSQKNRGISMSFSKFLAVMKAKIKHVFEPYALPVSSEEQQRLNKEKQAQHLVHEYKVKKLKVRLCYRLYSYSNMSIIRYWYLHTKKQLHNCGVELEKQGINIPELS